MGSGRFDSTSYATFSSSTVGKSTNEIYSSRGMDKNLDPKGVKVRESRDSTDNPASTPIIIALDVTGSMGILADKIARDGLGVLFNNILDRKPITDPHLMFMGVGDANFDSAPLQVSQFEADNRIVEQLTQLYLEHGGGGNNFESYNLPWYFAANHTAHDSYEKRGKRGYLFTIGDEEAPKALTKDQIKTITGDIVEVDVSPEMVLADAQRYYDVFHIIIKEGSHAKMHLSEVVKSWQDLLGQRVIELSDYTKLAETIVSAIEVAEGAKVDEATGHWEAGIVSVVKDAVKNIISGRSPKLLPGSTRP